MQFWKCANYNIPFRSKTHIMGIINTSPDSFSGDGKGGETALRQARQMIADGADILDIGGESTRPGATKIDADEELNRILPLIKVLSQETNIPISVDTTKAKVAETVLQKGASIINDISGGTFDKDMLPVISAAQCGYILMHLRGTPQSMKWSEQAGTAQDDIITEVRQFWQQQLARANECGVERSHITLDPGFGFGKSIEENLTLLARGKELAIMNLPLVCAVSRKSTIGKVLNLDNPADRIWGTASAHALAINNGYNILRVHDVAEMKQVAQMADAICTAQ